MERGKREEDARGESLYFGHRPRYWEANPGTILFMKI
jgi:hypothetical protein